MKVIKVLLCLFISAVVCSPAGALALTFDDLPVGTKDFSSHGLVTYGLQVADASLYSWGAPHSQSHVLAIPTDWSLWVFFGLKSSSMQSIGAYFSTAPGTVIRMDFYGLGGYKLGDVTVGSDNESFSASYVEFTTSYAGGISTVYLEPVSSLDALSGFYLDDLTITAVPEPSSILALLTGLAGIGGVAWRRRNR